jgi:hypothetical protein
MPGGAMMSMRFLVFLCRHETGICIKASRCLSWRPGHATQGFRKPEHGKIAHGYVLAASLVHGSHCVCRLTKKLFVFRAAFFGGCLCKLLLRLEDEVG